jgi:hypothetical protein
MRCGLEGYSHPRVFRLPSRRAADERRIQLPQSASLFPPLDLPQVNAFIGLHDFAYSPGAQPGSKSAGEYGSAAAQAVRNQSSSRRIAMNAQGQHLKALPGWTACGTAEAVP